MKWSIGTKIGGGFALAMVIFAVIATVAYFAVGDLIETADWVNHSHEVAAAHDLVLSSTSDAENGQRGYIITGEDRYLEPYNAALPRIQQALRDARRLAVDNPAQQRRLDSLEPLIAQKLNQMAKNVALRRDEGFDAARASVATGVGKQAMDAIRQVLGEIHAEEDKLMTQRHETAEISAVKTQSVIIWGTMLCFVLVTVLGAFVTRNVSSPLRSISDLAARIASGDLTVSVSPSDRTDEVGAVLQAFRRMVEGLQKDVKQIQEGAGVLGSAVSEILATTTQVAAGAAETATAVRETTATVEEVKQTVLNATEKAKSVSESGQRSVQVSQSGQQSVRGTVEGMHRIQEQMATIAESIVRLSEQSQSIGEIVSTVGDLAEQSNLLAVNAAIEAAKAGDQGKGFAVVAQEVKSLAEQSKQATAQVRVILGNIQKATSGAVMMVEQGGKAVEAGVKQSTEAGESIRMLAETLLESAQAAIQVAASSQQQRIGMDQIAIAMESIGTASSQNMEGTRQVETAAQNLHKLGQALEQLAARYTV